MAKIVYPRTAPTRVLHARCDVTPAVAMRDWWVPGVVVAAATAAIVATWYCATHMLLLGYQDAQVHLAIARRVFDNRTPGLVQLGTTWMPVPHVLLLPFVQNDLLWHTGLAGSIVGAICLVVSSVAIFLSLRLVTGRNIPGCVAVGVLLTNPSFLYIHTVALTEPVVIAAMTAGAYFLLRWARDDRTTTLIAAGGCAALAVGCRYDGWAFAFVSTLIVGVVVAVRTRNHLRTEGYALSYGMIPAYAVLVYLVYNWTYFGDPLAFQHISVRSASPPVPDVGGLLPTKGDLWRSLATYHWAVMDTAGWIVMGCGIAGFIVFAVRERRHAENWPVLALLVAGPFHVLGLYTGQAIMLVPQGTPSGLYNVRYSLVVLPALAVGMAYLYHKISARSRNRFVLPLCWFLLYAQAALWVPGFPVRSLAVINEGMNGQGTNVAMQRDVAAYLSASYDGGGVLLDDTTTTIFTLAPLDVREYVSSFNDARWKEALTDPAPNVRWIVAVNPEDRSAITAGDRVTLRARANPLFLQRYTRVYASGDLAVYRRNDASG